MNSRKIIFLILFLLSTTSSCSDGLPEEFQAPDFVLKDIFTGSEIKLSDLKGRPVILYFFASW